MQDLLTKFENLTIQSDFIFKKVMSRKRICKHLLEELLQQIRLRDITLLKMKSLWIVRFANFVARSCMVFLLSF